MKTFENTIFQIIVKNKKTGREVWRNIDLRDIDEEKLGQKIFDMADGLNNTEYAEQVAIDDYHAYHFNRI